MRIPSQIKKIPSKISLKKIKIRQIKWNFKNQKFNIVDILKNYSKKPKESYRRFYLILGSFLSLLIIILIISYKTLPSPRNLEQGEYPVSTKILDRHNTLLYEIYADKNRTPISLSSLPPYIYQASIAIEDQDFYHHFGFSISGIIRATKNSIFEDKLQGGSTITQQLVKTTLLTPERTIQRKIKEAILTIAAEILYSKNQILEMYLNHIPYGGTAYGIEAAAQRFFGKSAKDLSLAEASLLAGLPQAPTRYSPNVNPDRAKARQHEVLRRMVEDNYITQEEYDRAFGEPLHYISNATDIKAPHFVFYVRDQLVEKYGLHIVEQGGLRVTTTLDLPLQQYAEATVSGEVKSLEKYRVSNGAALVTHPNTGEILAMIGSKDYFDIESDGQVNLTTRLRQPGSSIKPINYVTAIQLKLLTPASVLLDIPTCFQVPGQPSYCPKNYNGKFSGPVSLRHALANSLNIPAVKILALNDLNSMIATASAMGISTFTDPSRYGLSLTLGGGEVTMTDMATAFGVLANQGVKVPLQSTLSITDYHGKIYSEYNPQETLNDLSYYQNSNNEFFNHVGYSKNQLTRVLNLEPSFLISHILADNNARSTAFGSNSKLHISGRTVSVKTGTTNDLRDNWTIGYTNDYLVATWVGNNDNSTMNPYLVSGVTGAAPIWNSIMKAVLKDQEDKPLITPPTIEGKQVCSLTGNLPNASSPCDVRYELFWKENLPSTSEPIRKNIWINKSTGLPAFFGSTTGKTTFKEGEAIPEDLELQEHLVISDPFSLDFCLDCTPINSNPEDKDTSPKYPTTTIDMSLFSPKSYQSKDPKEP